MNADRVDTVREIRSFGQVTRSEHIRTDYPSAPMDEDRADLVDTVANTADSDADWLVFRMVVRDVAAASLDGRRVDPNIVRTRLDDGEGNVIPARRYSAFWRRAAGRDGFIDADGWDINQDHAGGNYGKPMRMYRLRD